MQRLQPKKAEELIIELQRAWTAEVMDREEECGICRTPFRLESVIAQATTDDRYDMGEACPECVGYLGERNPERFPSFQVFDEALRRFPRAMFESEQALRAAAGDRDPSDVAYEDSWIWQVSR
jgi:hypothetical protein